MRSYSRNEYKQIQNNMNRYGGGFVSVLGSLLGRADPENKRRLAEAFPEYFKQYLTMLTHGQDI